MRAAIYIRISTDEQAKEGFSLSAQEHRLGAYAVAQGWTVAGIFRDDGRTGRDVNRPGYSAMMSAMDTWDVVAVLKLDRLHRNVRNLLDMLDSFKVKGKELASLVESLDTTTAMGRFVLQIMAGLAQLESEVIGERTLVGMMEKARLGKGSLGARTPYGYRRQEDGRLILDPLEAEIVREMYRLARAGMGADGIAKSLNRDGSKWSRATVWRMLQNPVYCGCIRWQKVVQCDQHVGAVTKEQFMAVQAVLKSGVTLEVAA